MQLHRAAPPRPACAPAAAAPAPAPCLRSRRRRARTSPVLAAAAEPSASGGAPASSSGAQKPAAGSGGRGGWAPPSGILKISPELLAAGGLDVSREGPAARASFEGHLSGLFHPLNLDHPGLRILNIDPPVLTVEAFLSPDQCDAIIHAASATGLMKQSGLGVGGYEVADTAAARTSSTLAATTEVLSRHPDLAAAIGAMTAAARRLLGPPLPPADGAAAYARPSRAGQVAFELPQVARYATGQRFTTHEDAFPAPVAATKGYQRRATLLTYLNDVPKGGATHFDVLGFGVRPRRGTALLFFPSFLNGVPDRRTLHTAQDAEDEKWVTQQWLSVGVPRPAAPPGPGGMPAFVRGVKGAPAPPPKGRKRGVQPQRINTKI